MVRRVGLKRTSMALLFPIPAPPGAHLAEEVACSVEGIPLFVHSTPVCFFAACTAAGGSSLTVELKLPFAPASADVRPKRYGVEASVEGATVRCTLPGPGYWSIEPEGGPPLYLFAELPETDVPDRADPRVRWIEAGRVHDLGLIELRSGETLYLEAGAIVRGTAQAVEAENVRVCGRGILDARHLPKGEPRMMLFDRCQNVRLEGITLVGPPSWMVVLGACEGAVVEGIKEIGWHVSSDGVDICGSRAVRVANCFLRNNDDCIAVKACGHPGDPLRFARDVEDVLVDGCTLYNDRAGNAMEVGFETRTASMRDIRFRNIDVIAAHGFGAVFSIHAGDRAEISNVRFEDIRVDHYFDLLVDFRVLESRWSRDSERGRIHSVLLKQIRCIADRYNTLSVIGGFDADHRVEGVHFEDFQVGGKLVRSADDLNLYTRHASNITFA